MFRISIEESQGLFSDCVYCMAGQLGGLGGRVRIAVQVGNELCGEIFNQRLCVYGRAAVV